MRRMGRTVSAEEALSELKNGDRIFIGSGCAQPQHLVQALADRVSTLYDVEIMHILTVGQAPYTDERFSGHVRHNAFFIGPNVRAAVDRGDADFTPANLSEIPGLMRDGTVPIDWTLIQVSPPDRHGYCSLGVSVDVVRAAVDACRHIVAQVNPCMPRTHGASTISVRDIEYFVECEEPLLELEVGEIDEVAQRIGQYAASLIEDGATLQAGIGAIPNAALELLHDRKDLGVHTEMFSDALVDLIASGAVTGRRKTIHPGKVVTSFAMGTRRLFDLVDDNPFFEFMPSEYVNDPSIISQNDQMVSINSALQVDLTGQVCADSIGTRIFSGIGGQVDFVRGSVRSNGGRSIIALRSTAQQGKTSRIAPVLSEGAGVVTTRADVHYVVTEYGIAELRGRSIRERAMALISVAHPDFRDELLERARERRLAPASQPKPRAEAYPVDLEGTLVDAEGTSLFVRPIRPADEDLLRELFYSHSEQTIYHRYGHSLRRLPPELMHDLVNVDFDRDMAIAAFDRKGPGQKMLAVARYFGDAHGGAPEVAVTVHDEHQSRGIGKLMFKRLAAIGQRRGHQEFWGFVQGDNPRMLRVFHALGGPVETTLEEGVYRVVAKAPSRQRRPSVIAPPLTSG